MNVTLGTLKSSLKTTNLHQFDDRSNPETLGSARILPDPIVSDRTKVEKKVIAKIGIDFPYTIPQNRRSEMAK